MERTSVLIPVYNSEKTIANLCIDLMQLYADFKHFQIILVNDGSRDNSGHICRQLYNAYPDIVTYVELSRNFGEHNALMAGLHYVAGDYCVIMDDDFQNDPQEVVKLTEEIYKGHDVVYTFYQGMKYPLLRRFGSWFNDRVATIVLRKPSGLYLSSFKCINRILIDEIIKFDGKDPYIDGIILRSTERIGRVLVSHQSRSHGQSGYTLRKLVSLWGSMALNFSMIPLRVIGVLGCIFTINSFSYAIYRRFFDPPFDPLTEYQWLVTLMLFLFGLLFFSIALLAEYIGKLYFFANKQPQYIVRKALNHVDGQVRSDTD